MLIFVIKIFFDCLLLIAQYNFIAIIDTMKHLLWHSFSIDNDKFGAFSRLFRSSLPSCRELIIRLIIFQLRMVSKNIKPWGSKKSGIQVLLPTMNYCLLDSEVP